MTGVEATSAAVTASVGKPGAGSWAAYQLAVCVEGDTSDCLPDIVCEPVSTTDPTECTITGATAGVRYTVRAAACPTEGCDTGVKSAQSAVSTPAQFTQPFP